MKTKPSVTRLMLLFALLIAAVAGLSLHSSGQAYQETQTPTPTLSAITPDAPTAFPTNTPRPTITPIDPRADARAADPAPDHDANAVRAAHHVRAGGRPDRWAKLRVGTYYNAFPFTWLNEYGEVVGYEADIIRAIGIELGRRSRVRAGHAPERR